ncbi:TPA: hypothetical protein DCQ44_00235 [Candidatus Taylorbacteria bacterium]|nr:hypothetical protein [Candidatus Taylorbacteria bacterium]
MTTATNYIIFESIGEASKDIMGTAVVAAIHRTYPDMPIVVLSMHPEVWLHNPDIYRVYRPDQTPYFYDDYVASGTSKIFKLDPYHTNDFLFGGLHLIEAWCNLCGVPYKGEMPRIYFTAREKQVPVKLLKVDKPIFLIQIHGEGDGMPYPIGWSRNTEQGIAQEVVDHMIGQGFRVLQIVPANAQLLSGAEQIVFDNKLLMATLPLSSKRLFIDSFPQHAAAALGLPSVVLWNTLNETRHGYKLHRNIQGKETPEVTEIRENLIEQFRISGTLQPHNLTAIPEYSFKTTEIIKALNKLSYLKIV